MHNDDMHDDYINITNCSSQVCYRKKPKSNYTEQIPFPLRVE